MLFYLEKESVDIIKDLEISFSWIVWVDPKYNDKCPCKSEAERVDRGGGM